MSASLALNAVDPHSLLSSFGPITVESVRSGRQPHMADAGNGDRAAAAVVVARCSSVGSWLSSAP